MNITSLTKAAINTAFSLGPDIVKDATYYRPPSFNAGTGHVELAELRAACKTIIGELPSSVSFGITQRWLKALVRASELASIPEPRLGDYVLMADGRRLDIQIATLDGSGQVYVLETVLDLSAEDWGDLTAHTASEDRGDLTATTSAEDYGALYAAA
jgi:hypothetical protein